MQAAATVAPARRPAPAVFEESPSPPQGSSSSQDPALVSQLQARFDALAIEEDDEASNQHQKASAGDGMLDLSLLDHHPSVLVLDGDLQKMPWESIASLQHQR